MPQVIIPLQTSVSTNAVPGQVSSVQQLPRFSETPGLVTDISGKTPGEFFDLLFDEAVMTNIQVETNRYAEQYIQKKEDHLQCHPHAGANAFRGKPIVLSELKILFAMIIMIGAISFYKFAILTLSHAP